MLWFISVPSMTSLDNKNNKKTVKTNIHRPKPVEIEYLEPPNEFEDREEMRRLFKKELEEIKKDLQFYEWDTPVQD